MPTTALRLKNNTLRNKSVKCHERDPAEALPAAQVPPPDADGCRPEATADSAAAAGDGNVRV